MIIYNRTKEAGPGITDRVRLRQPLRLRIKVSQGQQRLAGGRQVYLPKCCACSLSMVAWYLPVSAIVSSSSRLCSGMLHQTCMRPVAPPARGAPCCKHVCPRAQDHASLVLL
jgi:hypothetical protein